MQRICSLHLLHTFPERRMGWVVNVFYTECFRRVQFNLYNRNQQSAIVGPVVYLVAPTTRPKPTRPGYGILILDGNFILHFDSHGCVAVWPRACVWQPTPN